MPLYVRTLLVTGPEEEVDAVAREHREQVRALHDRGKLRIAGEFAARDGFLEIFDAADRLEAEEVARSSPLVVEGLATWMLREWSETRFAGPER